MKARSDCVPTHFASGCTQATMLVMAFPPSESYDRHVHKQHEQNVTPETAVAAHTRTLCHRKQSNSIFYQNKKNAQIFNQPHTKNKSVTAL